MSLLKRISRRKDTLSPLREEYSLGCCNERPIKEGERKRYLILSRLIMVNGWSRKKTSLRLNGAHFFDDYLFIS